MADKPVEEDEVLFTDRPAWASFFGIYSAAIAVSIVSILLDRMWFFPLPIVVAMGTASVLRYRSLYTVTNDRVRMRVGIVAIDTTEIPLRYIRGTLVRQGVMDRILGIGTIEFHSSAEKGGTVVFSSVRDPHGLKGRLPL